MPYFKRTYRQKKIENFSKNPKFQNSLEELEVLEAEDISSEEKQ